MRHTRPITVAPAETDPDALARFWDIFYFRVLVAGIAVLTSKT